MEDGWIKLHRKILDNPIVMQDAEYFALWVYLLLNATHTEYPVLFGGKKIMLQPGQLITGRIALSNELKISQSKVVRILNKLKIEQQIEQQTSNKNSLITLKNWSEYQQIGQQSEQQADNNRTTSGQQSDTNKNVKNNKNIKNVKNNTNMAGEDTDFDQFWKAYPKKSGKEAARVSFAKKTKGVSLDIILGAIEKQKRSVQWTKDNGQYIPNPATWLNQGRWEDELPMVDKAKSRDIDVADLPEIVRPKRV